MIRGRFCDLCGDSLRAVFISEAPYGGSLPDRYSAYGVTGKPDYLVEQLPNLSESLIPCTLGDFAPELVLNPLSYEAGSRACPKLQP